MFSKIVRLNWCISTFFSSDTMFRISFLSMFLVLIHFSLFHLFSLWFMTIQYIPHGGDDGRRRIVIKKNLHTHTLYLLLLLLLLKLIKNKKKEPAQKLKTLKKFTKKKKKNWRRKKKSVWNVSIVQQQSRINVSKQANNYGTKRLRRRNTSSILKLAHTNTRVECSLSWSKDTHTYTAIRWVIEMENIEMPNRACAPQTSVRTHCT